MLGSPSAVPVLIHDGAVVLYRAYWNADPVAFFQDLESILRKDPEACRRIQAATKRRPARAGSLSVTLAVPHGLTQQIHDLAAYEGEPPALASFVEAAILDLAQMQTVHGVA